MVKVRILKSETITDDRHDPPEKYEVYTIELRHGLTTWLIRRKYKAFCAFDQMLRMKFPDSDLVGLPGDAQGHERELIKEFIEKVTSNSKMLQTAEARSFFDVPSSRKLMDLSNDDTRSILSLPLAHIPGLKFPENFPEITIAHCLLLLVLMGTAPFLAGVAGPPIVRPIIAGVTFVFCMWQIIQPDGIIDLLLEVAVGKDNVVYARAVVRPADMPLVWMSFGMLLGFGLALNPPYAPQTLSLVYLSIAVAVFAFANLLVTLFLVESKRKKKVR